mgnify:CR=1 FL=1
MTERIIETLEDVAEGAAWLAAREPAFAKALDATGLPPLRRRPSGFGGLLRIVVGQQLSVAAADGVWRKLESVGCETESQLSSHADVVLQGCGLSRPKLRTARDIVAARLDYAELATLPVDDAIARLTAIRGVGPWTAEIYLMFCVGRADVFAPGDLALREGAARLFGLPERPPARDLAAMAEAWSPWRAVAARMLWAYYGAVKGREGISE